MLFNIPYNLVRAYGSYFLDLLVPLGTFQIVATEFIPLMGTSLIILRAFLHPQAHAFFLGVGGGLIIGRAVGERAFERLNERAVVWLERNDESCMLKESEVIGELEVSSGGLVVVTADIRATERQQWLYVILITHVRVRKDDIIRIGNDIAAAGCEPAGEK